MPPNPRPEIESLPKVHHGAPDFAELEHLGLSPDQVLDFSVNSNPYGPSPAVQTALALVPLDRYPDREALALRRSFSFQTNLPVEYILAGNGTAELIWLITLTYLQSGDQVLIIGPTFGEYANAAALMGAETHEWRAQPEDDFKPNPVRITEKLQQSYYRLVFICNPNNPTGQVLPIESLERWAQDHPKTLFVIDEAYISFAKGLESATHIVQPNVLVLRSITKDYALAGLRLGFAVGTETVIQALAKTRPPWSVNSLAQAAGIAALGDAAHLSTCLQNIRHDKEFLVTGLVELGLSPVPSQTHFFLLPVKDGAAFRSRLLRSAIQVRDCASFGLPAYVRIATRSYEENKSILSAIKDMGVFQMS